MKKVSSAIANNTKKKTEKKKMNGLVYRQHIFDSLRVGINARSRKKIITISACSQSGVFRLIDYLPTFFFTSMCIFPSLFYISSRIILIDGQVWQTLTISFLFIKCKKRNDASPTLSLYLSLCTTFRCKPHPFLWMHRKRCHFFLYWLAN
jgi:hypothetical protein